MFKLRWLLLGLFTAWGVGFAATALADGQGMAPPPDPGRMLAMDGPADDGPANGPGAPGVEAGDGGPGQGMGMDHRRGGPFARLNLTDDQKDKLKALRRSRRDKVQAIQNSLQDAREDLHDLLKSGGKGGDFNAKARAQNEKVLDLAKKLGQERFESVLEIREILTPAQLKKFDEERPGGPWRPGPRGRNGQGPAAESRPDPDPES
ncbi:MAG TPA: Spy/CpxP family protein refolding chaperone [bacterium]|nr:Spy/CpxP family protein refolding chaperone [bacterium]